MQQLTKDKIMYLKSLNKNIVELMEQGNLDEAKNYMDEYFQLVQDAESYTFLAAYYYQSGKYAETIDILEQGVLQHPFHYEINLNLGIIYETVEEYFKSMKYYTYAAKYSRNEEEKNYALDNVKRLTSFLSTNPKIDKKTLKNKLEECQKILVEGDGRQYPLDLNGNSLIRKVKKIESVQEEYLANMYKSLNIADINDSVRLFFKSELFKGQECRDLEFSITQPTVVPISLIDSQAKINFSINNTKYIFEENDLAINKYHYLRFDEAGTIKIKSNKNLFVGKPIKLKDESKNPKLVLKIFIDGLSFKFLEQHGLENIMPNVYSFFKSGFIATNCYATSEWTLPSKASIHTGKYATKHKLLHPTFTYRFEENNKLMAEYFQEAGYFTTNICSNWRTTPTFGYYKGFDRILYQNFLGGMDCRNVIMEAIEHISAFQDKNNFISISIMDLHNVPDELDDHLYAQVNTPIKYRLNTKNKGVTSVLTKYDQSKIEKYFREIQRVDLFLGILFDFIIKHFDEEEFLVILHSDHGQTFLEDDGLLHESRRKIPFMIRGYDVPQLVSVELIEAIDILPIMLKLCSLDIPEDIDGQLPICFGGNNERQFALTQAIHPGQSYKAVITDKEHMFYFETEKEVGNDLSINMESWKSKLFDQQEKADRTESYHEKISFYEHVIFEQVKSFLRWN